MCLTGVDYFSTLGYQPGIAAVAAGALSPIATAVLVLLTLLGALPIYRRVAAESPNGEGSIAMLEHQLGRWQGKGLVLVLLGFVATDFIITITLSAADASAHILKNPYLETLLVGQTVPLTLILVGLLGIVFLRGFHEAIGIAVALVAIYLVLNFIVIAVGIGNLVREPSLLENWQLLLFAQHGSPAAMIGVSLLIFPKLALGLSGFETGVAVMPLVRGEPSDTVDRPRGRIRNTAKLLTTAAFIMSAYLLASSLVTTTQIPAAEFREGGKAYGRALAYLAHGQIGSLFGSLYDLSTIAILWFAGASAMAGLLNIVPRYLPRYGMAPDWTRATRPLVFVFTAIGLGVTILFQADVEAQGGAYATGVLVLMSSAALAVTLLAWRTRNRPMLAAFAAIALVFAYTTVVNVFERPDGIKIASFFIIAIVATSLTSRVFRSLELRIDRVEMDDTTRLFLEDASRAGDIRIIANRPEERDAREYLLKEREERESSHIPPGDPVIFLEVTIDDASEFAPVLRLTGEQIGEYRVIMARHAAIPNAIAAFLIHVRDLTGKRPHAYLSWREGNPLTYLARFVFFGEGDIAPLTREILRREEPDRERRPAIHVG